MKQTTHQFNQIICTCLLALCLQSVSACAEVSDPLSSDMDGDWLLNSQETNTGVFVSLADTGTDPDKADTDEDGTPDGIEINAHTNPTDPMDHPNRPNIIFILVDDLGYGDIGVFYQNSRTGTQRFATPQLDRMAQEGMMLTHHYVPAPVCAPSRCSLLQGRHQGHANVRDNQFDKALEDNHTLATVLGSAGYYTAHVGKYGLPGPESEGFPAHPLKRGFDEFFGYLKHRDGHEHYPRNGTTDKKAYLVEGTQRITFGTDTVYTTDVFTARAKKIITDQSKEDPNRPLFLYLCYDTPHFKLQVPSVPYPEGRGLQGGIQWTGAEGSPRFCNTAHGTINSYVYPEHSQTAWPNNEKIHATMVRRIDDCVSDILQLLQDLGMAENTLVVFSSDNGPHHEGGQDPRFFGSYAFMDGTKRDLWEAGIRVPTIAWWPDHIPSGIENAHASGFWDWLPTFADLAHVPAPAFTDGVSLVPTLTQRGEQRAGTVYIEYQVNSKTKDYTEFEPSRRARTRQQMQAIRLGSYMGVRTSIKHAQDDFEIYDVVADPKQTLNLAQDSSFMAMQASMKARVLQVRRAGGGVNRPYDQALVPAVSAGVEPGLDYAYYEGLFGWVPETTMLTPVTQGVCTYVDVSLRERDTQFALSFEGFIRVPEYGIYTFYLNNDSGAHLRIHDIHVIDDDYGRGGSQASGAIGLEAGLHPVRVTYRHSTGTPRLQLAYAGPGIHKQWIPESAFFHLSTGL